jgi:opacity protein-like surface antigen
LAAYRRHRSTLCDTCGWLASFAVEISHLRFCPVQGRIGPSRKFPSHLKLCTHRISLVRLVSFAGAACAADKFEDCNEAASGRNGCGCGAIWFGFSRRSSVAHVYESTCNGCSGVQLEWLVRGLNAGWVGGSGSVSNDASIVSTSSAPANADAMALGATNKAGASSSFIGGGQFGYNYQFSGSFIAGFEADISGLTGAHQRSSSAVFLVDNNDTTASVVTNSATTRDLSYLGTLRARVGVLAAPELFLYVTGGVAYGGARSDTTIAQSVTNTDNPPPPTLTSGSFSGTRVGYAVGVGGEWMLSSNWAQSLDTFTTIWDPQPTPPEASQTTLDRHPFRAAVRPLSRLLRRSASTTTSCASA